MQTYTNADKFIVSAKKSRVEQIANKWIEGSKACPLYTFCFTTLKKMDEKVTLQDRDRILQYMLNKFGLDYRNGFTAAIDQVDLEEYLDEQNGQFMKGYEDGEYCRIKLGL